MLTERLPRAHTSGRCCIGRIQSRVTGDCRQASRGGGLHRTAADGDKPYRVALEVGEEEQLVRDDRTTDGHTVTVGVKSGIGIKPLLHPGLIHGIEIAISEIFIDRSVKTVCSALNGGIKLPARRVAELGIELVGKQSKVLDCFRRNRDQESGHHLVVIVDALNREIVVARTLTAYRRACPEAHGAGIRHARTHLLQSNWFPHPVLCSWSRSY